MASGLRITTQIASVRSEHLGAAGRRGSGAQGLRDDHVERRTARRAEQEFHISVHGHDGKRRLEGDPESVIDLAGGIGELRERQAVPFDELVIVRVAPVPGHTDDVDLVGPFVGDLLDRGGFDIARASKRSPEPQQDRSVGQPGEVEFTSAHEGDGLVEHRSVRGRHGLPG